MFCSFKNGYHYYQIHQPLLILVNSWIKLGIQASTTIVTNLSEGVQMVCLYPGLIFLHCCNPFWNCSGMFWSFQIWWICFVNFCLDKLTLFSHFLVISSERQRTSDSVAMDNLVLLLNTLTGRVLTSELFVNSFSFKGCLSFVQSSIASFYQQTNELDCTKHCWRCQ